MSTDIESNVSPNGENPASPVSLHVPVSYDIPSTYYASSFSQHHSEDFPTTKSVKRQLFTPQQLSVEVTDFKDQVSIPDPTLDGV